MKIFQLKPKVVLWWGIVIAFGGLLLTFLLPLILNGYMSGPTGIARDALVVTELVTRIAQVVFPPLGSAFIGAALVVYLLDKKQNATPDDEVDE